MEATAIDETTEIVDVGARTGGGFIHTSESKPMKHEEAIAKDPVGWGRAVDKEHERMKNHLVFKAVPMEEVPKGAKILTSAWAMKHKADGTLQARVTARGHEQKPGEHCEETGMSSPVVNEASMFITLILAIMVRMHMELNDRQGAFLEGPFSHGAKKLHACAKGIQKVSPNGCCVVIVEVIARIETGCI